MLPREELARAPFTNQSAKRTRSASAYLTEDFLGHARLYCFADKYGIAPLQALCLENLRICLIDCECQESQLQGFAELLAYALDSTPSLSIQNAKDLRSLVLDFAVIVYELLIQNKTFQELLESDVNLGKELLLLLPKRLD